MTTVYKEYQYFKLTTYTLSELKDRISLAYSDQEQVEKKQNVLTLKNVMAADNGLSIGCMVMGDGLVALDPITVAGTYTQVRIICIHVRGSNRTANHFCEYIRTFNHSWLVRYFFGKSALRFFSAFKCVSPNHARFHEKNEKRSYQVKAKVL